MKRLLKILSPCALALLFAGPALAQTNEVNVYSSRESKLIKPLLVISCRALATKLLADPSHPARLWLGW